MTRAILRGYDLAEPDQTHAVRLLGSVFHGYVSLEMGGGFGHSAPRTPRRRGPGSWTHSTPCCATGPRREPSRPAAEHTPTAGDDMHTTDDWITTPITMNLLRGALDLERTEQGLLPHRLPARARARNTDGQLAMAESQPSGVRLALRTRATALELDTLPTKRVYAGVPPRPDGVYDLLVDGRPAGRGGVAGGNTLTIDMTTGTTAVEPGPVGTLRFAGLARGRQGHRDLAAAQRGPPNSSPCARTPPSSPPRTRAAGSGCTTAARSATAPTPRAPPPPGPHSRPPSAASNSSTWAWRAAPCSTPSPRRPCATPPPI